MTTNLMRSGLVAISALLWGAATTGLAQEECDTVKACAEQMVELANSLKAENELLVKKVAELAKQISDIRSADYVSRGELSEEADRLGLVKFDSPLSIRDSKQPSVVITRHGGNYLSPYPEGQPGGSSLWVLRREEP